MNCQIFLIFISLSLSDNCFALAPENKNITSFDKLISAINKKAICGIKYNPSKTAIIVNVDCGSAIYMNLIAKKTYTVIDHWPNVFTPIWLNDTTAKIKGPCGTGCSKSVIFVAPSTVVSCAEHEYRINNLDWHDPPDFSSNSPLLVDVKKGIYVCYDEANNIQVFPLPKYSTIHPPKGFYSEKAEIHHNQLVVTYENGHGKMKQIPYDLH